MTTCDEVTAEHIACRPLAALWRGFTHPGVSWEGTMNTGAETLVGHLAAPATAELGEQPGGDSYAIVSADYINFSAKFAFHFSTVDALCGDEQLAELHLAAVLRRRRQLLRPLAAGAAHGRHPGVSGIPGIGQWRLAAGYICPPRQREQPPGGSICSAGCWHRASCST
ncbi:MAG: hypothetical protein MZV70_39675 [Desulfobacterales bacterium]|nr:hypothetical protein [Desulfobacterales bacterium]